MNYPCQKDSCTNFSIFIFFTALLFALIEIEIEGKNGWAQKLPTPNLGKNKDSLTLYHLYMGIFIFFMFTLVFVGNPNKLNLKNASFLISVVLIWFLIEDFMWFTMNPYYTKDNLLKASWHDSIGCIPKMYIFLFIPSVVIAYFSNNFNSYLNLIIIVSILSLIAVMLSKYYHKFYKYMHQSVDKNL